MATTRRIAKLPDETAVTAAAEYMVVLSLLESFEDGFSVGGKLGEKLPENVRNRLASVFNQAWGDLPNERPRIDPSTAFAILSGKL